MSTSQVKYLTPKNVHSTVSQMSECSSLPRAQLVPVVAHFAFVSVSVQKSYPSPHPLAQIGYLTPDHRAMG